jgi:hypothetical protein
MDKEVSSLRACFRTVFFFGDARAGQVRSDPSTRAACSERDRSRALRVRPGVPLAVRIAPSELRAKRCAANEELFDVAFAEAGTGFGRGGSRHGRRVQHGRDPTNHPRGDHARGPFRRLLGRRRAFPQLDFLGDDDLHGKREFVGRRRAYWIGYFRRRRFVGADVLDRSPTPERAAWHSRVGRSGFKNAPQNRTARMRRNASPTTGRDAARMTKREAPSQVRGEMRARDRKEIAVETWCE